MSTAIADIVEEHFSEASFLASQWERALRSPRYNLEETSRLEERLLAHLDGLTLGGETAAALLRPAFESEDSAEVFCAVFASIAESPPAALEQILTAIPATPPAFQAPLRRALELSGRVDLDSALAPLLSSSDVSIQALASEVLSFRGSIPREAAFELLNAQDERTLVAALRSLGTLKREDAVRKLPRLLNDTRPQVRMAAIECGLASGIHAAWDTCRNEAQGNGEAAAAARVLQAIWGDDKDTAQLVTHLSDASKRADVLWALGFSGRPLAVDACLEFLKQETPVARLAGEAFSAVTGLELRGVYAVELEEEESLPPLEKEDLDADLSPKFEDELPVPAFEAVTDWWRRARRDFSRSKRYVNGVPFDGAALWNALTSDSMRRRHIHTKELSLRTHGTLDIRTLAFTSRQREELLLAQRACKGLSTPSLAHFSRG